MTSRAPAQPGDVVAGKYLVRDVIGRGGVGVVVAADHRTLRCPVALKFLRPEIAYDARVVQRFLREAHAAARLRSEHVARVMDADETEGGAAYMVMELLEGRDFSALLKEEGPLPVRTAVDYLLQACEAVAEAHSVGIVHRDIKPANLFLTRRADGTPLVKVLDFGLSKLDRSPSHPTITTDDHVVGSPHFMSPEQMRSSREADERSDIWSLGAVLYTLLAGRKPFEGTYLTEVCSAILSGAPPALASLRPEVPEELAAAVERCLCVEPEDRFQTVADLVAALAPFAGAAASAPAGTPGSAPASARSASIAPIIALPPAARRPARRRVTAIVALGAVAAVALVVVVVWRARSGDAGSLAASPEPPSSVSGSPAPEPSATETVAPSASAAMPAPAVVRTPAVPRRASGSGVRRTAPPPAPPAAAAASAAPRAAKPKSEEDVILGLPH